MKQKKKGLKKRILAFSLAGILCFGSVPQSVYASEDPSGNIQETTQSVQTPEETVNELLQQEENVGEEANVSRTAEDTTTGETGNTEPEVAIPGAVRLKEAGTPQDMAEEAGTTVTEHTRLIVVSESDLTECYGATECIRGYGNLHILTYEDATTCENAYAQFTAAGMSVEYDETVEAYEEEAEEAKSIEETLEDTNKETKAEEQEKATEEVKEEEKQEIVVAVIDTGADSSSKILKGRIKDDRYIPDTNGHGTLMAEIIASNTGEEVRILPIQAFDENGKGTVSTTYLAMMEAIEKKADIINLSVSGKGTSPMLASAIRQAKEAGIPVIVSAGNNGADTTDYMPGNITDALTVSAVTENKEAAAYSNQGKEVDFCAIGTVTKDNGTGDTSDDVTYEGTSVSAAYLTAYASMILAENPQADVEACLKESAEDLGETGWDNLYGYGYISRENIISNIEKEENENENEEEKKDDSGDMITGEDGEQELDVSASYNSNQSKTGYHVEKVGTESCHHDASGCAFVGCNGEGLAPSDDYLWSRRYVYNPTSHPLNVSWQIISVEGDYGNGNNQISRRALLATVDGDMNVNTAYDVARPCTCSGGYAGYTYIYWMFSYCEKCEKWICVGSMHKWIGSANGDIGTNEIHPLSCDHAVDVWGLKPNTYHVNYDLNGATYINSSYLSSLNQKKYTYDTYYTFPSANAFANRYNRVNYDAGGGICTSDITGGSYDHGYSIFSGWDDNTVVNTNNGLLYDCYGYQSTTTFNAAYYANIHPDLMRGYGYDKLTLWNHYYNHGVYEGRSIRSGHGANNLDSNDLYMAGKSFRNLTYTQSGTVKLTARWKDPVVKLPTPTREGYTFLGWYKENKTYVGKGGTSYTVSGTGTLYARWKPNTYYIDYDGNGADRGSMDRQTVTYDTTVKLKENAYAREGYTFTGWNTKPDGSGTSYADKQSIRNLSGKNGDVIKLYAQWKENKYTLVFNGNGADIGSMESITVHYTDTLKLPKNLYENTTIPCTYMGWIHDKDALKADYEDEEELEVKKIIKKAGKEAEDGATITMYAFWDIAPEIEAKDWYIGKEMAENMTEEQLLERAKSTDREDGDLERGKELVVVDFDKEDFLHLGQIGSCTVTFQATDSAGNITYKDIKVEVSEDGWLDMPYYIRFISEEFYGKKPESGGCVDGSVWNEIPEYKQELTDAFARINNNTGVITYVFERNDIKASHDFTEAHGFGEYEEDGALNLWLDAFAHCKQ